MYVLMYTLKNLEEGRGRLLRVLESEGHCIAIFDFGGVALPGQMAARLRELIGKKIAILKFEKNYKIRCLDGEDHAA